MHFLVGAKIKYKKETITMKGFCIVFLDNYLKPKIILQFFTLIIEKY